MTADDQQISSVWTRPPRARRDQPALSREQIVAEAVRLLDAEGLQALSMRRLGARLGAGATSLYRHVANKDELIELVLDEIYGELRVPPVTDPAAWREAVIETAGGIRAMLLRHPWAVSVIGGAGLAYLGPNLMRITDDMLALLESAGFGLEAADSALSTVVAYVMGMTSAEAAWLTKLAGSGLTQDEWAEQAWPAVRRAVEPYPRLRRLYAPDGDKDPQRTREEDFTRGLNHVLDGFEPRR
ncbi:TetR/AcrR family transcriptional regulator [Streptomyces triculaminicus]|uniref:TetR/AcrR family transcriptional regulator n=1 Tax=Streptomyces triculaminicus TaxID=2816232 RepID=UPI0033CBC673